MVSAPSFSQPYLCIQPTLQSPPKSRSSTSIKFHLSISFLLIHKIIFTIPINLLFLYTSVIFYLLHFAYNHSNNLNQNIFPSFTISPIWTVSWDQGARESCEDWHFFNSTFFLKVWTMITGLTITDSLSLKLRKLEYCSCGKPSNPPSFIPSTYCHYFQTQVISPQELTFSWKSVA